MGANAVTTVPVYTAGEVLTAADLNITNSGIPVFATTTTRDAAFGGAGEKALAEGQFAYIEATNTTQYYDGAAWQSVGVAPGLVLIAANTFSAATSVSLPTNTFSSTYRNYKVIFDITATTARSAITLRFRTAGTDNSSADYTQAAPGYDSNASAANLSQASATSLTVATNFATEPIVVNLDIFNPQLTLRTWGTGFYTSDSSAGAAVQTRATGFKFGTTTSFDSMSLISSVASSMTGVYRVYGYSDL
jgi:hypothetical protein